MSTFYTQKDFFYRLNGFSKAGSDFAGWATSAGGAAVYANQENYTMGTSDVTLYAKWTPKNLTITFQKNDVNATGSMTAQTIASGSSALLKANSFEKSGWTFAGWATSSSGPVVYQNQQSYTMGTSDVTLWAVWTANNYSVTFFANRLNTTGTMTPQLIASGSTAKLKTNAFAAECLRFMGWATTSTGPVVYTDGANYTMGTTDVTLYAIWDNATVTVIPAQGDTINHTSCGPITVTTSVPTSCITEYAWHGIWIAMANLDFEIVEGTGGYVGAGTPTLTEYVSNMYYYCIITDLAGNQVKTGVWFVGDCP